MKPVLKSPGPMPLKLRFDGPLSSFAFNFNLRRYKKAGVDIFTGDDKAERKLRTVGWCKLKGLDPVLKAPGSNS
jgi:hypothetical protein